MVTPEPTADARQIWPVPADDWRPETKITVTRFITQDEAICEWAELFRTYLVASLNVGDWASIPVDEARAEVFKNARPTPCPTVLRDGAQRYCAQHFHDQVVCDGIAWYLAPQPEPEPLDPAHEAALDLVVQRARHVVAAFRSKTRAARGVRVSRARELRLALEALDKIEETAD